MTRVFTACVLAGTLAAALSGCWSTEDDADAVPEGPFPVMAAHLDGFASIFAVGDVLLGSQPNPIGLTNARDSGVTMVINARPEKEMSFDESALVRGLGMKYISIPFTPSSLQPEQVMAFIRVVKDPTREGRLLVHCSSGNRAAALWAAYEISELDVPPEAAVARAREMGLRSPELIGFIGDFSRSIGKLKEPGAADGDADANAAAGAGAGEHADG